MVSFELIEQMDSLLRRLQSDNYLIQALPILSEAHNKLLAISASAFVVDSQRDDSAKLDGHVRLDKKAKGLLKKMMEDIKGISPNKLFVGIEALKKDLIALNHWQSGEDSKPLSLVQTKLQEFSESYEHFITRTYNYPDAVDTLLTASALKLALESTVDLLSLVRENLERGDLTHETGVEALSIFLPSDLEFSTFIQKLTSLEKMYVELCSLLSISTKEQPLRMVKVESGSLWVKLFGESKVIELMTSLIESAAMYIYRNYTREGRIVAIPRKIEAVRSILDMAPKLRDMGIDTGALKEHIEKSSVLIAQQLNHLLANEPSITVNENYYSAGITAERRYLGAAIDLLPAGDAFDVVHDESSPEQP